MSKGIDLGLGDLSDITPATPAPRTLIEQREQNAAIDVLGREQGFTKPSMPTSPPKRQKQAYAGEAQHQISIKGPVAVISRFMEYCDRERLPYWEAIDRLMASDRDG